MNEELPKKKCFLFHRWSKWEQYEQPIMVWDKNHSFKGKEDRQKRHCLVCNKVQDVEV